MIFPMLFTVYSWEVMVIISHPPQGSKELFFLGHLQSENSFKDNSLCKGLSKEDIASRLDLLVSISVDYLSFKYI